MAIKVPTSPEAGVGQVRATPLNTPDQRLNTNADMFGANKGRDMVNAGRQLQDASNRLDAIAMEQKELLEKSQLLEAEKNLEDYENAILHDPEKGAYAKKGKSAFGLSNLIGNDYDKFSQGITKGFTSQRQRLNIERLIEARRSRMLGNLQNHERRELNSYYDGQLKARIQGSVDSAANNYTDQKRVQAERHKIITSVEDLAQRNGMSEEEKTSLLRGSMSAMHSKVVERMLAHKDDQGAQAYLEKNNDEILPGEKTAIESKFIAIEKENERAFEKWQKDRQEQAFSDVLGAIYNQDASSLLTQNDLETLRSKRIISASQFDKASRALKADSDDVDVGISNELWREIYSGEMEASKLKEEVLGALGNGINSSTMRSMIKEIDESQSDSPAIKEYANMVRNSIASGGFAAVFDENTSYRREKATIEFKRAARQAKTDAELEGLAESFIRRYRSTDLGPSSFPRPVYQIGNLNVIEDLEKSKQATKEALRRGEITRDEARKEVRYLRLRIEALQEKEKNDKGKKGERR